MPITPCSLHAWHTPFIRCFCIAHRSWAVGGNQLAKSNFHNTPGKASNFRKVYPRYHVTSGTWHMIICCYRDLGYERQQGVRRWCWRKKKRLLCHNVLYRYIVSGIVISRDDRSHEIFRIYSPPPPSLPLQTSVITRLLAVNTSTYDPTMRNDILFECNLMNKTWALVNQSGLNSPAASDVLANFTSLPDNLSVPCEFSLLVSWSAVFRHASLKSYIYLFICLIW